MKKFSCFTPGLATSRILTICAAIVLFVGILVRPSGAQITLSCCDAFGNCANFQNFCPPGFNFATSSTCHPNTCPLIGACCIQSGSSFSCITMQSTSCFGATFYPNAACTPGPCPKSGACCVPGTCLFIAQQNCFGSFNPSGVCTPDPCNYICCIINAGSCTLAPPNACSSIGGITNISGGSFCSPSVCPSIGACCNSTTCAVKPQYQCTGTFQGPSTICGPAGNPTTCCKANFDHVGGVTVSDIFAFLRAWFAKADSSDFDGSGAVQVSDIFAFLRAWFAKC